ncbi:hypothetical protein [Streptomyces sp. NBC_00154]|uniref:hypothetical protein n=1 Tax=Streptomyces sp. NBC_00154 TaxID=2975670 RepID=UPI0022510211|nr:hypothetical protein [Streptomyces sp. NBC_00154]
MPDTDLDSGPVLLEPMPDGINADDGGGMYVISGSTATLTDSTVENNTAQFGGGISNEGGATLNLSRSTVKRNTAIGQGGGIYNGGTVNLAYSTVERNTAEGGRHRRRHLPTKPQRHRHGGPLPRPRQHPGQLHSIQQRSGLHRLTLRAACRTDALAPRCA